jgi:methionyl-tRNA formyltransferase
MGTPAFSVATLAAIADAHEVVACYTRAPKPAGRRGLTLTKSPVHELADTRGIPVFTPRTLRDPEQTELFRSHNADVAVVVAYGLILPKPILDAPRHGCLNLHASLLPRWRGAAPIQRAIMAGDAQTGVMVMRMEEGLDTGPVALTARLAIEADATAGDLHDALMVAGAGLAVEALGRAGAWAAVVHAAARRGRALRSQDREGRVPHRLVAAVARRHMIVFAACRRFPARGSRRTLAKARSG